MSGNKAAVAVQARGDAQQQKPGAGGNRIQVSSSKKPLFFYVNLAKKCMRQYGDVELSALGLAISSVVTIAEILKNNGLAVEKNNVQKCMRQYGDVELSALGLAISSVVTIAEILKNNGLAVEKKIRTSTVEIGDEMRGRSIQKAKIEIVLGKTENFDELMAAGAGDATSGDGEEQS